MTHLVFNNNFNQPIAQFPPCLHTLSFGGSFNQSVDHLPPSIAVLSFGWGFRQSFNNLPPKLTYLKFPYHYQLQHPLTSTTITSLAVGQVMTGAVLPTSLQTLSIYKSFEHEDLLADLPQLTRVCFGEAFNQPLTSLPQSIIHLSFDPSDFSSNRIRNFFNSTISCTLPLLTHLTLSKEFNQPVDNLPPSITHLSFGWFFNQPVDYLPPHLIFLYLRNKFNQPINHLPHPLTHLILGDNFNQAIDQLPPLLTHLIFGNCVESHLATEDMNYSSTFNHPMDHLPSALTHLIFGSLFTKTNTVKTLWHDEARFDQPFSTLPPALIYLELGCNFNKALEFSPKTVITHLTLGTNFRKHLILPESLTHLRLNDRRKAVTLPHLPNLKHLFIRGPDRASALPVQNVPLSVTHLTFGQLMIAQTDLSQHFNLTHFSANLGTDGVTKLPPHLSHFFYALYDDPLPSLPPSLTHVGFNDNFNDSVLNLPATVRYLYFGEKFDHPLSNLPNLIFLYFKLVPLRSRAYDKSYYKKNPHLLPSNPIIKEGTDGCKHFYYNNFVWEINR